LSPAFLLAALLALAPPGDPLDRLQVWIQHARMAPRWADFERQEELRGILGELRILRANPALDPSPIDLGLVQLASLGLLQPERIELAAGARMGRAELVAELARPNEVLPLRLAREVLAPEAHRPRVERLLAAELLRGARDPAVLDVLRATAREPDGELARSAQEALCGWPHPGAHLFFLQLLERDPSSARLVAQHFERTRPTLDGIVLRQDPAGLAQADPGSVVTVTVGLYVEPPPDTSTDTLGDTSTTGTP